MNNIINELKTQYGSYPFTTQFVIQEHYATSFHFDLRIKKGNVAPSWAIPKAKLPTKTYERYLAVRTSDHPLSFMRFSGVIPNNQYGAGTVQIYDYGECIVYTWRDNYIVVKLMGEKIQGFYALIKKKRESRGSLFFFVFTSPSKIHSMTYALLSIGNLVRQSQMAYP